MNILIPHKWLLEHLETNASPDKIQETLSLCGPSVERIEKVLDDSVYDIEVTTNRVDSASVRGIAREAAAILPEFDIQATLIPLSTVSMEKENFTHLDDLKLEIKNDSNLCDRIMAMSMIVDSVSQSPQWLQDRLTQVGQRPLNALIDITNYVMWELGHPIHVFDLDKLESKKIIVRQANKGETLTTLDNKIHTLNGGEVVFDNGQGEIVDLPGIMGTANSVVSNETKNILVWIESIPAKLIRQASMGLSIRTQAAVLNEKNVDPALGEETLLRSIELYQQICDAKPTSKIYDDWPNKPDIKEIKISHSLIETYLGLSIPSGRVTRILENLGFIVTTNIDTNSQNPSDDSVMYEVTPPSGRVHDLEIPQDVIEEIARIYGYHNLPSVLMDTSIPNVTTNSNHTKEHTIKTHLADWGATEVYTYSLVSEDLAKVADPKLEKTVKLANPLTTDMTHLRTSLIPSHSLVFETNSAVKDWLIFEMANTYHLPSQSPSLPIEKLNLVISTNGEYFKLKQILDNLFFSLRINKSEITVETINNHDEFNSELTGVVRVENNTIGYIGKTIYGFFSCVLDVEKLIEYSLNHPHYIPIPKTSAIIEDLTFTLKPDTNVGPLINQIKNTSDLITKVELKSKYQNNYTFTVSYQNPINQLTVQEVTPIRSQIVSNLVKDFEANLVGQV